MAWSRGGVSSKGRGYVIQVRTFGDKGMGYYLVRPKAIPWFHQKGSNQFLSLLADRTIEG